MSQTLFLTAFGDVIEVKTILYQEKVPAFFICECHISAANLCKFEQSFLLFCYSITRGIYLTLLLKWNNFLGFGMALDQILYRQSYLAL